MATKKQSKKPGDRSERAEVLPGEITAGKPVDDEDTRRWLDVVRGKEN